MLCESEAVYTSELLELVEGGPQETTMKPLNEMSRLNLPAPPAEGSRSRSGSRMDDNLVLVASDMHKEQTDELRAHIEHHERTQDIMLQVMERRGLRTGSRAPFVADPTRHSEASQLAPAVTEIDVKRREFTQRILQRVKERGIHGIRTLRVMWHGMDFHGEGTLHGRTFEGALTHLGIRLKQSEYTYLLELFGVEVQGDGLREDHVDYVAFLSYAIGHWSETRVEVVRDAYRHLSELCPGKLLTMDRIEREFDPMSLTVEMCPMLASRTPMEEFMKQWSDGVLSADGVVTWIDFLDYYLDVSWCFESHHDFCAYVCKAWGLNMDDWLAKKVFRRYVGDEPDECLQMSEFTKMLAELDPEITEEEARAWYDAIDVDDSGEVDLNEFISSKILMAKRLFDQYLELGQKEVDQETMVEILMNLSETMTRDEALALYQYADLDGSGEVSFTEFLENNLLRLLQIFADFDRSRGGFLNESKMKALLRKEDPFLDDYDIQQIYKAIDTDGGGKISFLEFCESQVLRAKMLFDRYDVDRSRALTQFKFRELMLDMDSTLSSHEMEAIYTLVCNPNTLKVHLGGFLNPNIVRLKLLFDKHDQDRSRHLDIDEFKVMLRELYKDATNQDVEELCRSMSLQDGITFTDYIRNFKDLSRRYELMQLAKRRRARNKALNKGLAPATGGS